MEVKGTTEEGIEVIVGTYEEFLLGYKLLKTVGENGEETYEMEQSFTNHSHCGSIRSVAVVGKFLASGSADEAIRLINMGARVEHGYLQQQSGTITCLENYESGYLFSGCEDGTICIWKGGSWICEKTLRAHVGGVLGVSIHPSGKLALSVGKDRTLKTWNLIKGRTGFVTNLHGIGDVVRWSPNGAFYAVGISNRVDVYSIETAKVVYSIPFGKRVSCICFPEENTLIVAGDKDTVEVHDIKTSKKLSEFKAHEVRVKDMKYEKDYNILVTGSNCDQLIKLWRFVDDKFSIKPSLLVEHNTTCRLTCLTIWNKNLASILPEMPSPDDEEVEEKIDDDEEISEEDEPKQKRSKKPLISTQSKPSKKEKSQLQKVKLPSAKVTVESSGGPARKKKKKAKTS